MTHGLRWGHLYECGSYCNCLAIRMLKIVLLDFFCALMQRVLTSKGSSGMKSLSELGFRAHRSVHACCCESNQGLRSNPANIEHPIGIKFLGQVGSNILLSFLCLMQVVRHCFYFKLSSIHLTSVSFVCWKWLAACGYVYRAES